MDYSKAMDKVADAHQKTVDDFQKIYDKYGHAAERGEMPLQDIWRHYEKELGLVKDSEFDFLDYWISELLPIHQNHHALAEIAQSHPVGLLTNMYLDAIPLMIKKGKIPNVTYAKIIESSVVRHIKPEEQIFKIAQESSGYAPEDIIYIDDRRDFTDFAKSLGWNSIWYTMDNGVNLKQELSQIL